MTDTASLNPIIPAHLIELKAKEIPNHEVLIFEQGEQDEKRLTYRDIYENSNKIARLLLDKGIGTGDTVVVYMKNHPEFVYSLIATNTIGAIMVPVDPRTRGDRLKFLITDSDSKAIIATDECIDTLEEVIDDVPKVKFTAIAYHQHHEVSDSTPLYNLQRHPGSGQLAKRDTALLRRGCHVYPYPR